MAHAWEARWPHSCAANHSILERWLRATLETLSRKSVSGKTYDKFAEERIFVPLRMTSTAYEGRERSKAERALGYIRSPQGFAPSPALSMSGVYAAGALVSTVDDLARWDAAVSSGKVLKATSKNPPPASLSR